LIHYSSACTVFEDPSAILTISTRQQVDIILRKGREAHAIKQELARSPAVGFLIAF